MIAVLIYTEHGDTYMRQELFKANASDELPNFRVTIKRVEKCFVENRFFYIKD